LLDWTVEHHPDLVRRARVALLPKDAVRNLLVPSPVTDRSDASATLLWDLPADGWAEDLVAALGLPSELLPQVAPSDAVVGTTGRLRDALGASGEVPVVVGAADTPAAWLALGTGSGLQVNLGSGGQVLASTGPPGPVLDPLTHTYADAGRGWYRMAAVQNAGTALEWVCRVLAMSWNELFAAAAEARPGATGVSFLPFLQGERGGVASPAARAGWVGADAGTTRQDLARAAVEGVVFAMRRAADLLDDADDEAPVALTGGGGRSALVQQLLADVLARPVRRPELRSASATGAALLAARGTGGGFEPQRGAVVEHEPSAEAEAVGTAYEVWLSAVRANDEPGTG
jgi:xylulokinase